MPDQNEGALKFTRLEEYLREYKFDNAEEFMDAILAAYRRSDSFDFIGAGLGRIIFRGVDTDRFPIIPSAFRSVTDLREYQPYGFGLLANNSEQEDRKNFLFDHRERELRAIFHFLEYSDYLGIPTPLNYQSFALSYRQSLRLTKNVSLEPPHYLQTSRDRSTKARGFADPL